MIQELGDRSNPYTGTMHNARQTLYINTWRRRVKQTDHLRAGRTCTYQIETCRELRSEKMPHSLQQGVVDILSIPRIATIEQIEGCVCSYDVESLVIDGMRHRL